MKTYDLKGAAEFLHVSPDSMRDMADSGRVPAAKVGPTTGYRWVFTDEGLEEYLRNEIRVQTAKRRSTFPMPPINQTHPLPAPRPARRKPTPPPKLPELRP